MKKILLILILFIPVKVSAIEVPELNSDKYIIYDLTTKEVLSEQNSNKITSIASLTKIMTVITAIEKIEDLNSKIIITKEILNSVYWNASRAGLKIGDAVTYKDLLYASILPSGADATNALAFSLSGSINNFVIEMNNLAKKIGLENTNFANVTGIDNKNNYSTIYDIAKMLEYALANNTFKEIYTTKEYTLINGLNIKTTLLIFNKEMNLDTSRIIGSKSGHTGSAGYCLSSLINSNNHEIIIITTGAEKINNNFYHVIDTLNLIDYTDKLLEENLRIEEETIKNITEQEKKNKLVQERLIVIQKNQIYVNKVLIIGAIFFFCLFIAIICKPNKKRKK